MTTGGNVGTWINPDTESEIPIIDLKVTAARMFVQNLDRILNDKYDTDKLQEIFGILDSLKGE